MGSDWFLKGHASFLHRTSSGLGTRVFLVAAVLLLFLHCGCLYHSRWLKLRLCCFKIQTQKGSKEHLFIMTRTHSMQIVNLFVFGSCFKMPAVILFQILGCFKLFFLFVLVALML